MVGVTADSNIYVSALNFGGVPDKLLDMARAGDITLSISDEILDEIERVLCDKFRWTEDAVKLARERIGDLTEKSPALTEGGCGKKRSYRQHDS